MSFQRGSLLIQTGRYAAAEQEYRAVLSADPNSASAHALLAHCLSNQKRYPEAEEQALAAISLGPGMSTGYSALATVYMACGRLNDGVIAIERAIAIDPSDVTDYGVLAAIRLKQRRWKATLDAADAGLAIDPHNVSCVNARGIALSHLGRLTAAVDNNAIALNHNPECALIHANQGWAMLRSGEKAAALEHFRESLRLDPNSEWARQGFIMASNPGNTNCEIFLYAFALQLGSLASGCRRKWRELRAHRK